MAGGRSKKSRKEKESVATESVATDWLGWEYDYDKGCYVNSKFNSDGELVTLDGGLCDPPSGQSGLEKRMDQISLSPDEPQTEGDEVPAQEEHMLLSSSPISDPSVQLSTSPYASTPGLMSYSQGQGGRLSSGCAMAQYESTVSTSPPSTGYNSSYGRGQVQAGTWQSNIYGNAMTQPDASTTQTTNYNFLVSPPTGPANDPQRNQGDRRTRSNANFSIVEAKDTFTDISSKSPLSKEFKVLHSSDFKERRVFKVLWTEPHRNDGQGGGENNSNYSKVTLTKHGQLGYTSIRRFVVWKNYEGHALCLPILTYGKRGTTKPGVKSAHHAIIFTESKADGRSIKHPPREAKGEKKLPNAPVCVEVMHPRHQLDEMSRLNYAKVYTVEHNIRVCFIGRIHKDSAKEFKAAYDRIQNDSDSPVGSVEDAEVDQSYDGVGAVEEEEDLHPNNREFRYM